MLNSCWSRTPTKRPTAAEIAELLYNNPRLVSPCIDVPLASVQIERTDSLEMIPTPKRYTPAHDNVVGSDQKYPSAEENKKNEEPSNQVLDKGQHAKEPETPNTLYSPMTSCNPPPPVTPSTQDTRYIDTDGYYKADFSILAPLLVTDRNVKHSSECYQSDMSDSVAVGSYVQPGYIHLGKNNSETV